ncbi:MAG: tRNA (N6-isopentenyl adenosine(37)-C2)-methylthiotransferase MiaB [Eubacteriaceae bacterium]|nr:tRNA (N6-isopentenyl adenosine(37)-C2)-methylthiotransferase MiaB [Eubacteriaceae bacterium]
MNYKIITYGCQMNENDSEKIAGMLKQAGHSPTEDENEANIIILNTCSVRENANDKFFGHLGYYKKLKKEKKDLVLCICGCMMQQDSVVNEIKSKYRHVDMIFGTHNIHEFPQLLADHLEKHEMVVGIWEDGREIVENIPVERKHEFKAYVSIMFGCNNFCSYCIVPYTRGRERSRTVESIRSEVEALAKTGCKEITLLGQNVNSYGNTLGEEITFPGLLKELAKVDGIERIRFMTSHPKDISLELIETIAGEKKLCNHVHLPVQAGNSRVLSAMNRKYSKEDYLDLVRKIKVKIPGVALTTDIIVGFPGETEEEFMDTMDILEKCEFDSAYTFLYSPREGTPAYNMEEQIDEDIKHERLNRFLDRHHRISKKINQGYLGKVYDVLVEGLSKNNPDNVTGRTETNKTVNFKGDVSLVGQIVKVKITQAKSFSLDGEIVS